MYLEKRTTKKSVKYYLAHSFREGGKVHKSRVYLGSNLNPKILSERELRAKDLLSQQLNSFKIIRSPINYKFSKRELDLVKNLKAIAKHHISGKLKIAPEHVNEEVLKLMNKKSGNLDAFVREFNKMGCGQLTFYFMTGHPGSSMKEAQELADKIKHLQYAESVQIFTPTPMTVSTCMYYTGMDPVTRKKVYVPYTYAEKKEQKRILDLETKREKRIKNATLSSARDSRHRGKRVSTNKHF